jgi:hypothetical protein
VLSIRIIENCPYRSKVRRPLGLELAECALVERWFSRNGGARPVSRLVCGQCCVSAPPGPDRFNDVVASQVYLRAQRVLGSAGNPGKLQAEASRAREAAIAALKLVWATSNSDQWTGEVYNLRSIAEVIDSTVTPDTFADHLRQGEPFAYLRYGDGEWLSILGRTGRNNDGHDFFPETLGRELRRSLEYGAQLWPRNDRYYMGLNALVLQVPIRRYLIENEIAYRAHWVSDNLFALGYRDFSTRRFLEAVKCFAGPKTLAGNRALAPVATGLGCRHVIVPRIDCYLEMKRLRQESRFVGPGLLLCCAGMASECLIARLHRENPHGSYVDCGHIFDALTGNLSRDYTQANSDGILGFLDEHYGPLIFGASDRPRAPA